LQFRVEIACGGRIGHSPARIAYLRVGLRARFDLVHAPARTSPTGPEVTMAHVATKPIDLYFWPIPNGWKISIMLEIDMRDAKVRAVLFHQRAR
jgi:hypothetical protein